ncbi:MAG: metallophosphoesterase [Proteobacteria bacterium]|nr:metallophosphoesterase [Desulfobacteraceae bacterium]MBU4067303.1 metallophosphoesterase [Pseudomonadota bacterium]
MSIFISAFLSIYGGLHYYIYKKAIKILPLSKWVTIAFLGFMVVAPLLIRLLTNTGFTSIAVPLAWVGYIWMGFAFLFFSFSVVLDFYQLSVKAGGKLLGFDVSLITLSPFYSVFIAAILSLMATGCGFVAARQINVEWVHIPTIKINKMSEPFRIVQISDLHLGLLSNEKRLRRLVETIESIRPDVVVSTGDLIDMQLDHLDGLADLLLKLNPRFGKFAVTGNHEAYAGIDKGLIFTKRAGFKMLSYEGVKVGGVINIVGVDDPAVSIRLKMNPPAEEAVLQHYSEKEFTLLLKHRPTVIPASVQFFDLQLSGHTHGGQIFPFNLITKLVHPAKTGLSQVGHETWLYVNRGIGTWGPPIRFMAPPEMTVIELRPAMD